MKFDELDRMMRIFETAHDDCVLPEIFMVARLDGRARRLRAGSFELRRVESSASTLRPRRSIGPRSRSDDEGLEPARDLRR